MQKVGRAVDVALSVFLILSVLCAIAKPAYGYVDPGSGLFAAQILSTTLAGMLFLLRQRLRLFFRRFPAFFKAKGAEDTK